MGIHCNEAFTEAATAELVHLENTPAGCSKRPNVSPAQPWRLLHPPALSLPRQPLRPGTRLGQRKAAAIYHLLRGGWDGPNCARPRRAYLSFSPALPRGAATPRLPAGRALREHRDRPSYPAPFFSILLLFFGLLAAGPAGHHHQGKDGQTQEPEARPAIGGIGELDKIGQSPN